MSKAKKIGILTLGQGINTVVNFLFLPYMSRVLEYEEYGSYGQAILVVTFLSAILSAGLGKIIFVYLSENENINSVLKSNITAGLLMSVIGICIVLLNIPTISDQLANKNLEPLLFIFCFNLLFIIPNQSFNSFLIYSNKVKTSVSLIILGNIIKTILVVAAIQLFKSVSLALLGIVISQFILFLTYSFILRQSLKVKLDLKMTFEQIKKGYPLGLTGIVGSAILYSDGVMISKMIGVKSYAIYRNGAFEVPLISTIYGSIAAIILPEVSKLFNQGEYKKIALLKKKVIMNSIFIIYPVFIFMLFNSVEFITIYLGDKYIASAYIFFIFNFTLLIRVNDYSDILISANKTFKILQYYIVGLVLNLILNYFLILQFGIKGAAISTVISISTLAFLQLKASLKIINTIVFELINPTQLFYFLTYTFLSGLITNFITNNLFNNTLLKLFMFFTLFFILMAIFMIQSKYMDKNLFSQLVPSRIKRQLKKYGVR